MTTAHILLANDDFPRDKDMLDLYQGMLELGYGINFYYATDVVANKLKVEKGDIFCGTVNLCRVIWRNMGVKEPASLDYPASLTKYLHRNIKTMDLMDFRNVLLENECWSAPAHYFIKPVKAKLFTGKTFNSLHDFDREMSHLSSSTKIYITKSVNFLTEYRVYVHKGLILGVKHYYGKWDVFPNPDVIADMVTESKNSMPVSYSIDVGVLPNGETALVECNDSYSLGNYGLEAKEYAEMHRDRWMEITNG